MNIFGHIIADDQVIGIGPLMVFVPSDQLANLYNKKKLYFDVYLKGIIIKVESEMYYLSGNATPEADKEAAEKFATFKKGYFDIQAFIDKKVSSRNVRGNEVPNKKRETITR